MCFLMLYTKKRKREREKFFRMVPEKMAPEISW